MLKKADRLSTKAFMEVMEKGRIITSPLFVVRILSDDQKNSQIRGISAVAPKKIASTAVLRNKMRRQMYEAMHPLVVSMKPGKACIVFAKQEALKADVIKMRADLEHLFEKAKISV